jgi:cephalosporin-C deacetylase
VPLTDKALAELWKHTCRTAEPDDLDGFWRESLDAARAGASPARWTEYRPDVYRDVAVYDVTFSGSDGSPISGWFIHPRRVSAPVPCLVSFIGYGGGRGVPADHMEYAAAGFAQFVMDTRGQGGNWSLGVTGDPGGGHSGAEYPGMMTRGIGAPESYYYRRLFVDAVRAVETAASHGAVDRARIGVGGGSQGGGLSLAAAALAPGLVQLCHADVPFLCDIEHAIDLAALPPYTELAEYFSQHDEAVESGLRTLAHFDCALLAKRIRARCVLSVGLMDEICPPSTVFAAYNAISSEKELAVYRFAGHTVPDMHRERRLADFAAEMREGRDPRAGS